MAAWRATQDRKYLDRAIALAEAVTAKLAAKSADLPDVIPECARAGVGALHAGLVHRPRLQPRRPHQHLPPLGLPDRPPDRVDEAAAAARSPVRRGRRRARARASRARARAVRRRDALRLGRRARRPRLRLRARRHALRRRQVPLGAGREPGRRGVAGASRWSSRARRPTTSRTTGAGTTASGTTRGRTSSTTDTVPGIACWRPTTRRSPTRRAPPARSTTTTWARATTCSRRCARSERHGAACRQPMCSWCRPRMPITPIAIR